MEAPTGWESPQNLMNKSLEYPYWYLAVALGSLINVAAFMLIPSLGYNKSPADVPVIVVDFMEWREPASKPVSKLVPVKPIVKSKPEPRPIKRITPNKTEHAIKTKEAKLTQELSEEPPINTMVAPKETPEPEPTVQTPLNRKEQQTENTEEALPTPVPIFKLTSMPRFVHRAHVYPPSMQRQGKEAIVKLEALIDKNGNVRQVKVIESAGLEFDQAAIDSLQASTFIPGNVEGKAVAVLLRIPVKFELR